MEHLVICRYKGSNLVSCAKKNSEETTDIKMIIGQKVILKVKISKTGEDRWIRGDSIKGKGRSQR